MSCCACTRVCMHTGPHAYCLQHSQQGLFGHNQPAYPIQQQPPASSGFGAFLGSETNQLLRELIKETKAVQDLLRNLDAASL